jgi:nucleoside-diphosphate-sugar epimerase
MHTILGAGGIIGTVLLNELVATGEPVRLVGRTAKPVRGVREVLTADLADPGQALRAVSESTVAYLVVGLKYELGTWKVLWPTIMRNTIEACKRAGVKLVFLDNVYMYGRVNGAMTEETPFNPCSRKGEIRSAIASTLLNEMRSGNLTALIARAADFYGPYAQTGVANVLVFDKFAKGGKAAVLVNDSCKHSYSFTPDIGKSLVLLGRSDKGWGQTWHLPAAASPPSGREFVEMAAGEFGVQPRYTVLKKWMLRTAGLFDATIRELPEMLYQNETDYLFDSTKFDRAFGFTPTPYADGIRLTAIARRK